MWKKSQPEEAMRSRHGANQCRTEISAAIGGNAPQCSVGRHEMMMMVVG